MSRSCGLSSWETVIASHFPGLSLPQSRVLAWWSFGIYLAQSCALTAVIAHLFRVVGTKPDTLRQRLREWLYNASDKKGDKRQQLDVEVCFAPLFRWIVQAWVRDKLFMAVDASSLKERFVVLSVSVCFRGCAIPVAWTVLPAAQKGEWRSHWLRMLRRLHRETPRHLRVFVLADRGLYARWLFRRIVRLKWHPLLRVNSGGGFRPVADNRFHRIASFVQRPGDAWEGPGDAFKTKTRRLSGVRLLAYWHPDAKEPWFLLTDREDTSPQWYARRAWIEQQFRLIKRGGWNWQNTRITDPQRAERLWLALAVSTLIVLHEGYRAEDEETMSNADTFPEDDFTDGDSGNANADDTKPPRPRIVSLFRTGCAVIRVLGDVIRTTFRFLDDPLPKLAENQAQAIPT